MRPLAKALLGVVCIALVAASAPLTAPAAMMQLTGSVGSTLVGLSDIKVDMSGMDPDNESLTVGEGMVFAQASRYLLPDGETRVQDLYLWAQMLDLDGTLDGDLIAWVQNGTISGTVTEDVTMFAQDLRITGEIQDDLRVFSQNLWIDGTVKGDLLGFAANMTLSEGAVIEGNVLAAGGVVLLNGDIGGDARVASGTMTVNGSIAGNADLKTDGGMSFGEDASVGGDLRYQGPAQIEPPEGVVSGSVTYARPAPDVKPDFEIPKGARPFFWILRFIMAIVAGSVIIALTKNHARKTAETIRRKPLKSLGIGFIALICVPIISLIGMVLVVPFMLAAILGLGYLIAIYIAKFYVALWLGNLILRRSGRTDVSPVPAMLLGLLIVYIVTAIPIAGTLLGMAIIPSLGIGALLQRRETRLNGAFEGPQPIPEGLPDTFPGGPQTPQPPQTPAPPSREV
jgi:cytoskeletal protein CcmA (bactofilin family)